MVVCVGQGLGARPIFRSLWYTGMSPMQTIALRARVASRIYGNEARLMMFARPSHDELAAQVSERGRSAMWSEKSPGLHRLRDGFVMKHHSAWVKASVGDTMIVGVLGFRRRRRNSPVDRFGAHGVETNGSVDLTSGARSAQHASASPPSTQTTSTATVTTAFLCHQTLLTGIRLSQLYFQPFLASLLLTTTCGLTSIW